MAPLVQKIASIEVEPLEIVLDVPEQDRRLATLTTAPDEVEVAAILTGKGAVPVNDGCCCCCCIPAACCCC